jgi:hypothetical protein
MDINKMIQDENDYEYESSIYDECGGYTDQPWLQI